MSLFGEYHLSLANVANVSLPNTEHITSERVLMDRRTRFNPIRAIKPELLADWLDMFDRGYLRQFALAAEVIEQRDWTIKSVAPKRKKAVSRLNWEILTHQDSPEAKAHQEALEYFYRHLRATDALDAAVKGGVDLLIRQMMDAIGKKYAIHEIIWRPSAGGDLTAELKFCPLWFFENMTGKMRFLEQEYAVYGSDLEENGWMITVGDGIMQACSIAYIFCHLTRQSQLIFSERFGMPGVHGKSSAAKGSPEWNAMCDAVAQFAQEFAIVTNESESISLIERSGGGELPYPSLIEGMERAIATLWRGGDLSTISKDNQAVGSQAQDGESDLLQEDDAVLASSTLQEYIDRAVIAYRFGPGTEPLAYFQLLMPGNKATAVDLSVDQFLLQNGARLGLQDTMERYNRPIPDDGDELLMPKAPESDQGSLESDKGQGTSGEQAAEALANSAPIDIGHPSFTTVYRAIAADMQPVSDRLARIMQIMDIDLRNQKLAALQADLANILSDINADPAAARAIAEQTASAISAGYSGQVPSEK